MKNVLIKSKIAYLMNNREETDYQRNLEAICDNRYRLVDKVQISTLFFGILETYKDSTVELIKEVIQEALETSGFELTFVDEDWKNLAIIESENKWIGKYLNTTKGYMTEFFEK